MKTFFSFITLFSILVFQGNFASARVFPLQMKASKNADLQAQLRANSGTESLIGKKVVYYGGPVISHAQVIMVLWGDKVSQSTKSSMPDFYASILNSSYMDWLSVYNTTGVTAQNGHASTNQTIGRGSFLQTVQIKPSILTGVVDDLQIQAELEKQINAGVLPKPSSDTLYMIHFPPKLSITMHDGSTVATSCQQFCAYHEGFKSKTGSSVIYGVIPDLDSLACSMGCGRGNALARITVSTSHELIEAITDAFPTPGSNPNYPQAWNTTTGEEVGDLCQSSKGVLKGKAASYTVQQEWNNATNACTTGNYASSK